VNLKFFIIGIALVIIGGLIFRGESRRQIKPRDNFEMMWSVFKGLFAGEYYSLAVIFILVGLMFVLYSFNII